VVEHLPTKYGTLSSHPNTAKINNNNNSISYSNYFKVYCVFIYLFVFIYFCFLRQGLAV
jgi:hypothetical protein